MSRTVVCCSPAAARCLRNLDTLFLGETGVAGYVAEDALSCVAIGAERALENSRTLKDCLMSA